jgi:hypothetical protein
MEKNILTGHFYTIQFFFNLLCSFLKKLQTAENCVIV